MQRLILLTIAFASLVPAADKPDFSGNWVLKVDQSKFGKNAKPTRVTLVAKWSGDTMHSEQTTYTSEAPTTVVSDWVADGKEHETSSGKMTTRWEGNTLYSERVPADSTYRQKIPMLHRF